MSSKKNRLSELRRIPTLAGIDHRHMLRSNGELPIFDGMSRNERRKLNANTKKLVARYNKTMVGIRNSGAGYPIDQILRDLAIEYTHRYASSGIHNQPMSFNYFEAFCRVKLFDKTIAPFAEPLNEVDHLFTLTDYIDYATSNDKPKFDLDSLLDLPENQISHFTTNGDILDFSILNADGKEFVISGFSIVRRGTSLHWYIVGGECLSQEEWDLLSAEDMKVELQNVVPSKRAFLAKALKEQDYKRGPPVALEGTPNAVRTIVGGEINLASSNQLSRFVMTERENSFGIISDDPEIFNDLSSDNKREEFIEQMNERLDGASAMLNLGMALIEIPVYFAHKLKLDLATISASKLSTRGMQSKGGKGLSREYVTVPAIEIHKEDNDAVRAIIPPHYQIETDGHWRRLKLGATGTGPDGFPTKGRTWVTRKSPWRSQAKSPSKIFVKSTLEAARIKIAEYEEASKSALENDQPSASGVLYVMRCTLMKDEIFKVGWTSGCAEDRAKELSSNTGVPVAFTVVEDWPHQNAAGLEKDVHAMLEPYRVNSRREFFHCSFNVIRELIVNEIERQR